jgi:hypothetical protein
MHFLSLVDCSEVRRLEDALVQAVTDVHCHQSSKHHKAGDYWHGQRDNLNQRE